MKAIMLRWRANFLTGLAIILPVVASLAVVRWLFGTVSNVTDVLLLFLPAHLTHGRGGEGPMHWYWSLLALVLAVGLIALLGRSARYYAGKKLIQWVDQAVLRIPLLNKIYSVIKQVNDAFSATNKTAFKQVVMVEFPRRGQYSIGFITSEPSLALAAPGGEKLLGVFIPTTPNPTSGFLVLLPEIEVVRLDWSVANGLKFIISLGSLSSDVAHLDGKPIVLPSQLIPPATAGSAG